MVQAVDDEQMITCDRRRVRDSTRNTIIVSKTFTVSQYLYKYVIRHRVHGAEAVEEAWWMTSHPVKSGPLAGVSPSGQQPYRVR